MLMMFYILYLLYDTVLSLQYNSFLSVAGGFVFSHESHRVVLDNVNADWFSFDDRCWSIIREEKWLN